MAGKAGLLALAALVATALADCPNACSGHGDCGSKDQCICYDGFYGGDCSLRVCPTGTAFVDTPRGDLNHDGRVGYGADVSSYSKVQWSRYLQYESWPTKAKRATFASVAGAVRDIDTSADGTVVGGWEAQTGEAHFAVECSGKGACDRNLGICKCFDGYTGAACQRTTCPNSCSGHGICRTVKQLAAGSYSHFEQSVMGINAYSGVLAPFEYRLWDGEQNAACVCDVGYSGIDCSLRECPRGDDPLTTTGSTCGGTCIDERQSFSVDGGQGPSAPGTYYLSFRDYSGLTYKTNEFKLVTDSTVANWATWKAANEAAVKAALEALPNNVTGLVSVSTGTAATYGAGGATPKEQLRLSVTFTTKSGNVPEMTLGWRGTSNANTLRAYVFQPAQPVKVFTIPSTPALPTAIQFKGFPLDQTLYGRESYWVSESTFLNGVSTAVQAADVLVTALNSIPAVKLTYGAPFVRDSNVIVTGAAGGPFTVRIAFPDKQFGLNKLSYAFSSTSAPADVSAAGVLTATSLDDVQDGNKEAALCSNRGLCDYASGMCQCFSGHTGAACETQNALAHGHSSNKL